MNFKFSNTTRRSPIHVLQVPQGFFDGVQNGAKFSTARDTCPRSAAHHTRSARAPLLARFSSFFRRSHTDDATQLQQRPRQTTFSRGPRIVEVATIRDKESVFLARPPRQETQPQHQSHGRGSSTIPPAPDTATRLAHSRPSLWTRLVLCLCCVSLPHIDDDDNAKQTQQQQDQSQGQAQTHATSSQTQQQQGQSQGQVQAQGSPPQTQPVAPSTSAIPTSSSRPDGLISRLFSLFRPQRHTNEDISHVVGVAALEDKGSLHVTASGRPQPDLSHPKSNSTAKPGAEPAHSLPVRLLGHLGLFICCICNHQKADSNPQPTQRQEVQSQDQVQTHTTSSETEQQAQSQDQVQTHMTSSETEQQAQTQGQDQAQASSSQTQPVAPSTSATYTSSSRPDALISRMSSLFRPQTHTDEEIELSEFPSRPHVVGVAAVQDMSFSGVVSDD
ncbi:hypothetical protein F4604DRAFT_1752599 [Suillus subluteus]|nr:hypothetical protein F4604DRAFT_1752599 [Suillus subluteus]